MRFHSTEFFYFWWWQSRDYQKWHLILLKINKSQYWCIITNYDLQITFWNRPYFVQKLKGTMKRPIPALYPAVVRIGLTILWVSSVKFQISVSLSLKNELSKNNHKSKLTRGQKNFHQWSLRCFPMKLIRA